MASGRMRIGFALGQAVLAASQGTFTSVGQAATLTKSQAFPLAGLLTDSNAHAMGALAKPALLTPYTDARFGTSIQRVTNGVSQFTSNVVVPAYQTIPVWNCDETRMVLYVTAGSNTGHALFDASTYAYIEMLSIDPTDLEHFYWSRTDPDVIYFMYNQDISSTRHREVIKYVVSTKAKTVHIDLNVANTTPGVSFGSDPMFCSWDMDLWGFAHETLGAFTYRISNATRGPYKTGNAGLQAQISPSGRYYVVNGNLYDSTTNVLVRAMAVDTNEHACMTMLANGQDCWVAVQFGTYEGTVVSENLDTGVVTTVVGPTSGASPAYPYPPSGSHVCGICFDKPGWICASIVGTASGATTLSQEVLLVNLNNNTVYRVAHHHSAEAYDYWGEPHAVISPSGRKILFGSDWGSAASVDSYVVTVG